MKKKRTRPTPCDQLELVENWLGFLATALGNPSFDKGMQLIFSTASERVARGVPVKPGEGCGRSKNDFIDVTLTLPEATDCLTQLHRLLGEARRAVCT